MVAWQGLNSLLYDVNVVGTKNVVDACLKKNVQKLVLTSGLGVYWSAQPEQTKCKPSTIFNF